jgi:DNA-binding NtrC family response regulator
MNVALDFDGPPPAATALTQPEGCLMARILLIDDDADLSHLLQAGLEERGHLVEWLERAEGGPAALAGGRFDVVLLDNRMPGLSGLDFLAALQQQGLRVPVILMTGHATTDTAIRAMNLGAFDYVVKPLDAGALLGELELLVGEALRLTRPAPPVQVRGDADAGDLAAPALLGTCRPMLEVYKLIGRFARHDDAVLVLGETGTGKELVARAVHANSPRKDKPFVALNCTALNENLTVAREGRPLAPRVDHTRPTADGNRRRRSPPALGERRIVCAPQAIPTPTPPTGRG